MIFIVMKHHAKTNYFQVSLDNYDVLLSYPNSSKPNKVNFSNKLLSNPQLNQICIILIDLIKPTSSKQNNQTSELFRPECFHFRARPTLGLLEPQAKLEIEFEPEIDIQSRSFRLQKTLPQSL